MKHSGRAVCNVNAIFQVTKLVNVFIKAENSTFICQNVSKASPLKKYLVFHGSLKYEPELGI